MRQPLLDLLALSVELKRAKEPRSPKQLLAIACEISRLVAETHEIIKALEAKQ